MTGAQALGDLSSPQCGLQLPYAIVAASTAGATLDPFWNLSTVLHAYVHPLFANYYSSNSVILAIIDENSHSARSVNRSSSLMGITT